MRWVPTSRFKHSNPELLALYICRDVIVFVVWGVPGGPRGVSGTPPGDPRGLPLGPSSVPWGPRSVPGDPRGVPRGSPGCEGAPGTPLASQDSFHEDDSVI